MNIEYIVTVQGAEPKLNPPLLLQEVQFGFRILYVTHSHRFSSGHPHPENCWCGFLHQFILFLIEWKSNLKICIKYLENGDKTFQNLLTKWGLAYKMSLVDNSFLNRTKSFYRNTSLMWATVWWDHHIYFFCEKNEIEYKNTHKLCKP